MVQLWVTAEDLEDPTLVEAAEAAQAASLIMYALSGRKYPGAQTITEEYSACRQQGARCFSLGAAGHHHAKGRRLRGQPVRRVSEIRVNAGGPSERVLSPSEYEVVDHAYVRPTHYARWNPCSAFTIRYVCGAVPPAAGVRAARMLANELVKAKLNPDACKLPDRVTSVSRQGISMAILDPQDFLADGRTGLYEVDMFLKAVNPDKARKRARVFTPESVAAAAQITGRLQANEEEPGEFDLFIEKGLFYGKTFMWSSNGVTQPIAGYWEPRATVRDYKGYIIADLTPYLVIEPDGHVGRIDMEIPAGITSQMSMTGTWSLIMTRTNDPGMVVRLLSGDVMTIEVPGV